MAVYEQYMIWAVLDLGRASNQKRRAYKQLINEANCSYVDSTIDFIEPCVCIGVHIVYSIYACRGYMCM